MGNETDEFNEKLLKTNLHRYQEGIEKSMKESEFTFDSVNILYYNLDKSGQSYIDSPEWLKNQKTKQ